MFVLQAIVGANFTQQQIWIANPKNNRRKGGCVCQLNENMQYYYIAYHSLPHTIAVLHLTQVTQPKRVGKRTVTACDANTENLELRTVSNIHAFELSTTSEILPIDSLSFNNDDNR